MSKGGRHNRGEMIKIMKYCDIVDYYKLTVIVTAKWTARPSSARQIDATILSNGVLIVIGDIERGFLS